MVYKKSAIKVLLGPESLLGEENATGDSEGDRFPLRTVGLRKRTDNQVFEKIGETNVYKRTRPFQTLKDRPKIVRAPTNLTLAGQKVENEDTKLNLSTDRTVDSARSANDSVLDDMDRKSNFGADKAASDGRDLHSASSCYSPTLQRTGRRDRGQSGKNNQTISHNFLTDFGLRTERTDTFSGHQRRRAQSSDLERQLEMSAQRHIRTCQVVGNVKRSSRVQQSCLGLKQTVCPLQSPYSSYPTERFGVRRHNSTLRENTFYKSDPSLDSFENPVSYMVQIRRNVGSVSKMKPLGKPLTRADTQPQVNARTIIVGTSVQFS